MPDPTMTRCRFPSDYELFPSEQCWKNRENLCPKTKKRFFPPKVCTWKSLSGSICMEPSANQCSDRGPWSKLQVLHFAAWWLSGKYFKYFKIFSCRWVHFCRFQVRPRCYMGKRSQQEDHATATTLSATSTPTHSKHWQPEGLIIYMVLYFCCWTSAQCVVRLNDLACRSKLTLVGLFYQFVCGTFSMGPLRVCRDEASELTLCFNIKKNVPVRKKSTSWT